MAIVWSDNWEKQPQDVSNPGFGADQIRSDKIGVRERAELEHAFGPDELDKAAVGGVHLEGSGRVWINDDESTNDDAARADKIVDAGLTDSLDLSGRMVVDLNLIDPLPETDGSAILDTDPVARVRTIKCYDGDGNLLTVFDPDKFLSTIIDQTVQGVKTYIHQQLLDSTAWHTDAEYDALTAPEQAIADKETLPRAEIVAKATSAKEHDVFDPNDSYNQDEGLVVLYAWSDPDIAAWTAGYRSTKDITCNKFAASEVRAENLYGTVWG